MPEIDALFRRQANEWDATTRQARLHQMQRLVQERALFVPIWQVTFLSGVGPKVEASGLGLILLSIYSAPYEDVWLK